MLIAVNAQICQMIILGPLSLRIIYKDAKLDNKNGIYAQPDTGICIARSREPSIAPQNDIALIIFFIVDYNTVS
jgi:uncharacterized membrane protein